MSATSINVGKFRIDLRGDDNVLLTARPDMRIVKLGFLSAALIAAVAGIVYLSPISDGVKIAFLPLIGLFVVALVYSAIMYETLVNAVFRVTNECIEEEGGFIWKTQHRIPLSYVRDVTYDQSVLQKMLGVSSVTVSPTNGHKIVLSNIRYGRGTREMIWKLVMSKLPSPQRQT
jgi:membrane protein YdbS with pleckstrin-like domain